MDNRTQGNGGKTQYQATAGIVSTRNTITMANGLIFQNQAKAFKNSKMVTLTKGTTWLVCLMDMENILGVLTNTTMASGSMATEREWEHMSARNTSNTMGNI